MKKFAVVTEYGEYDLAECGDVWATAEEEIKEI